MRGGHVGVKPSAAAGILESHLPDSPSSKLIMFQRTSKAGRQFLFPLMVLVFGQENKHSVFMV